MCGRYTLTRRDQFELAVELGVPVEQLENYHARFNIAPLQRAFVLRKQDGAREALEARWGLVNRWAKDNSMASKCINARSETVEQRPAFRDAFQKRRCLVPADGFYEWTGPKGKRQPIWIHRPDGKLLYLAGLYEAWQAQPGEWETTYTILTCAPNKMMEPIHNRMPVILQGDALEEWINPEHREVADLKQVLVPAPDDLLVTQAASPRVNSGRIDDPDLLDPNK